MEQPVQSVLNFPTDRVVSKRIVQCLQSAETK